MRELSRFIEPLRQKIAAMGREDDEKLAKMRRLLEILCNPSKRLPMDTLKKCEAVLNRMQQTQDLGTLGSENDHLHIQKGRLGLLGVHFRFSDSFVALWPFSEV